MGFFTNNRIYPCFSFFMAHTYSNVLQSNYCRMWSRICLLFQNTREITEFRWGSCYSVFSLLSHVLLAMLYLSSFIHFVVGFILIYYLNVLLVYYASSITDPCLKYIYTIQKSSKRAKFKSVK